jgi:hypothetical protein
VSAVAGLESVEQGIAFPFVIAHASAVGAAASGRLHVAALDAGAARVRHVALDRSGRPTGEPTDLGMSAIAGMAAGPDLVVTGARTGDDRPVARGLDARGRRLWEVELPVDGVLGLWPRPALSPEGIHVLWATGAHAETLWHAEIAGGELGQPLAVAYDDPTRELALLSDDGALAVARTHGQPLTMEVLRIRRGDVVARRALREAEQPVSPVFGVAGGVRMLLWVSRSLGQVRLAELSADLEELDAANAVARARAGERLRSVEAFSDGTTSPLAIAYETTTADDGHVEPAPGVEPRVREPTLRARLHVGAFDPSTRATSDFLPVAVGGPGACVGGWLEDALLVVHAGGGGRTCLLGKARPR